MDNDRLLRNDFWKTVRSFAIAEELLVWEVDLSIGKPFSLSPGNILGYGAAFFLCQARHDGEQQFALAVKGVDVLFFEVDFYAFFFQFADGNQAVNRVSGEAADRLRDDEVDFTGHGIGDHFIKADAMLGIRVGNALIGIYLYELPFGIAFDVLRVVIHLRLVAGELLIAVCGHSCVYCVGKNNLKLYTDGSSMVNASGAGVTDEEAQLAGNVNLLNVVYQACLNGNISAAQTADGYTYTVALDGDGVKQLVEKISPDAAKLNPNLAYGDMKLYIGAGRITGISVSCTGTVQVVVVEAPVSVSADVSFEERSTARFPSAVTDKLSPA